jgi:hypothetical protein
MRWLQRIQSQAIRSHSCFLACISSVNGQKQLLHHQSKTHYHRVESPRLEVVLVHVVNVAILLFADKSRRRASMEVWTSIAVKWTTALGATLSVYDITLTPTATLVTLNMPCFLISLWNPSRKSSKAAWSTPQASRAGAYAFTKPRDLISGRL